MTDRSTGPLPPSTPDVLLSDLLLVQGLCTAGLLDTPPGVPPILVQHTAMFVSLPNIPIWLTLWTAAPISPDSPTTLLNIRGEVCKWPPELPQAIPVPTTAVAPLTGYRLELFGAFFP